MKNITLTEFKQLSKIDTEVTISITIEDVPQLIDGSLKKIGDMIGGCSKRLYWVGKTKFDKVENNNVDFHSKIKYEQWLCLLTKTKVFQDTKTVDMTIFVEFNDESQNLEVKGQVRNIRNVPNWVENILKIRTRKTLKSIDLSNKNASVEKITLNSTNDGSITVTIELKTIL